MISNFKFRIFRIYKERTCAHLELKATKNTTKAPSLQAFSVKFGIMNNFAEL